MLSGEVEERQQRLEIVDDLGHRLGPLRCELVSERVHGAHRAFAVLGVADLGQHPPGGRLGRLRQRVQDVLRLPAFAGGARLGGVRVHLGR